MNYKDVFTQDDITMLQNIATMLHDAVGRAHEACRCTPDAPVDDAKEWPPREYRMRVDALEHINNAFGKAIADVTEKLS